MQESLTLSSRLFSIAEARDFQGWQIPWEGAGYLEDFRAAESSGGFFDLSHWGVVEIKGPDARDYLQRMTTACFRSFSPDTLTHGAFLTGRGHLVALGFFQAVEGGYHFLVSPGQSEAAAAHIEQFHFAEKLTVADRSGEWALFGLWAPPNAPRGPLVDLVDTGFSPLHIEARSWNGVSLTLVRDDNRESLLWVKLRRDEAPRFLQQLRSANAKLLGQHLFEFFRIRAGVPQLGSEASEKEIILETGFDRAVARNKGCYPGQEVVERIFTYGSVNKKLMRTTLERSSAPGFPPPPIALSVDGKEVGQVVSEAVHPDDPKSAVGLAYVNKQYWDRTQPFDSVPGIRVTLKAPEPRPKD